MVERCNATIASLGYLEVGRDSLHKSLSEQWICDNIIKLGDVDVLYDKTSKIP
jgi:hypothetical protein